MEYQPLLPNDLCEELLALQLHPAWVNRYGEERVRWALEALQAERRRVAIAQPAAWVVQALEGHWGSPPAVVQGTLPFAAAAAESNRPPDGTRWGRHRESGQVLEVVDVNETRVQFAGGFNAPAVPAHLWKDWEWFPDKPGERAGILPIGRRPD